MGDRAREPDHALLRCAVRAERRRADLASGRAHHHDAAPSDVAHIAGARLREHERGLEVQRQRGAPPFQRLVPDREVVVTTSAGAANEDLDRSEPAPRLGDDLIARVGHVE
jgi:hypothetical protein